MPRPDKPQPSHLGITIPLDLPLAEHPPVLAALQQAGYTDLWTGDEVAVGSAPAGARV